MKRFARSTTKRRRILGAALLAAGLSLAPSVPASPNQDAAWLSLTSTTVDCTWTVTVSWVGFKGAKTLEVFLTETYTGTPLVPTFVSVNGKRGTATVTLEPLVPSATINNFYAWAQLLDSHGVAIPSSLISRASVRRTAPRPEYRSSCPRPA